MSPRPHRQAPFLPTWVPLNFSLLTWQFFIFSIFGWLYEMGLNLYYQNPFENRGFLLGPYLPIYGFGTCLAILLLLPFMKHRISFARINFTPLLTVILMTLIVTLVELLTGELMLALFQKRWWDYSDQWLNFRGQICPLASFRFAIGIALFLYLIAPLQMKIFAKFKKPTQKTLALAIIILLMVEFIFALARHF